MFDTYMIPQLCGWVDDPYQRALVEQRIRDQGYYPLFRDAAPHLAGSGEGQTVLLYEAERKVLGNVLPAQFQDRGTCVSRGAKGSVDTIQCVQIALRNMPFDFKLTSHAYIYGTCREHGGMLSNEDGAVGAWAAWSVSNDGVVANEDVGDSDTKDDLAVKWGRNKVPDDIKQLGRKHLIKRVAKASSFDEVRDAICNGYTVTVASNAGFQMTRDSRGVCRRQGSWSHQMRYSGFRDDIDAVLCCQSWGPGVPSGPCVLGQPDYSFWVLRSDAESQIREGDTWIFSTFDGWPAQKLTWLI